MAELKLHMFESSHPVRAAQAALAFKGLDYERVLLPIGEHMAEVERIYGEGRRTVPGMLVDGDPVHGTRAIFARLEDLQPEPTLYPPAVADRVREAEEWGEAVFQDQGRRIIWGALHFRPNAMATFAGGPLLDPAGTDFAITFVRRVWKSRSISAAEVAQLLADLPAALTRIDDYVEDGAMGGETPTAADLQIGATMRLLLTVGDLRPLIEGRPAEGVARSFFPEYPGDVPAGAFPAGWVP